MGAEFDARSDQLADRMLTEPLAANVLRWRIAKGRFLRTDKSWIAGWKFAPLANLPQAFELLDVAKSAYILRRNENGAFEAEVRVCKRVGRAYGEPKARTITLALARALGFDVPPDLAVKKSVRESRSRKGAGGR